MWQVLGRKNPGSSAESPSRERQGMIGVVRLVTLLAVTLGLMAMEAWFFRRYSALEGGGWRYLVIPVVILVAIFSACVEFVRASFSVERSSSALQYVLAALFSQNLPVLMIREGKPKIDPLEGQNLIDVIGGPGRLWVQPGSIALLETLDGQVDVVGADWHTLISMERVKSSPAWVKSHRRSKRWTRSLGMELKLRPETSITATGYAVPWIRRLTFNRRIMTPIRFQRMRWSEWAITARSEPMALEIGTPGLKSTVVSTIAGYISQNLVDHMTAPSVRRKDPRGDIYRRLLGEAGKKSFRERGAELLWVDIGYFGLPDDVAEQRAKTWRELMQGQMMMLRADLETSPPVQDVYSDQRISRESRTQAQADLFISLIHGLYETGVKMGEPKKDPSLYLTSIIQLLDTLGKDALGAGDNNPSEG